MTRNTFTLAAVLKETVKRFIPDPFLDIRRHYLTSKLRKTFEALSVKEAFTMIYTDALWGRSAARSDFCSGSGSHQPHVVATYVGAVETFLKSLDHRPTVVDLGCGDFSVGSQLRSLCGRYIACDVVDPLIERNRIKYSGLEVEFRVADITVDELPESEVVFIRQVLQHLSNELILQVLTRMSTKYRYLVLTEHIPSSPAFIPNLDKPTGPDTRLNDASGVVLTSPPFNLKVKHSKVLCEVLEGDGVIQTRLYEFDGIGR